MRYARIALLSAAATCLLPFATPAIAQDLARPHHHALRMQRIPPGATALAPDTNVAAAPLANGLRCRVRDRLVAGTLNYPEYITTCR
jgi:hypothetical protein